MCMWSLIMNWWMLTWILWWQRTSHSSQIKNNNFTSQAHAQIMNRSSILHKRWRYYVCTRTCLLGQMALAASHVDVCYECMLAVTIRKQKTWRVKYNLRGLSSLGWVTRRLPSLPGSMTNDIRVKVPNTSRCWWEQNLPHCSGMKRSHKTPTTVTNYLATKQNK